MCLLQGGPVKAYLIYPLNIHTEFIGVEIMKSINATFIERIFKY